MSRGWILLGIGGAGITTLAALFGTSQIKERNYQTKMRKFRETAKKVNGYIQQISSKGQWAKDEKVYDPEHVIWEKRWNYLTSQGWSDTNLKNFPEEAKDNLDVFKTFCFEQMELHANDLLGDYGVSSSWIGSHNGYWEHCLINDLSFKQLTTK
ncbi:hypothetical protein MHC_02990 [Mycoplasma haemocanis str. Illinois]|uniref:Uncharacterized protein n=1 Tax=Mycoplasma haemocanis (strain Illinois) TaxID=1111676 RepID=H6N738_MYCHN|nr:hypothetical protein [Mycoplasma haemocanis]AEW45460.1 hypothetical protein MHC_02990 [Mycoplasma haemocanis str. Illinois]